MENETISTLLRSAIQSYVGQRRGANVILFPILDDEHQIYAINAVGHPNREHVADVVVLARIVADQVVIEEDMTDKPLVNALVQKGVARDHIILAYRGEPLPDAERYELDL